MAVAHGRLARFYLVDDEVRVVSMVALALRRDAYRK